MNCELIASLQFLLDVGADQNLRTLLVILEDIVGAVQLIPLQAIQ